jgi:tetratricopeptide (TPR) repeat protein
MTSARVYIQNKNYDKAIEALNKEVAKNPKSDEGYYTLGLIYAEKEDADNMVTSYDKSLAISNRYVKEIAASRKAFWGNSFNKAIGYFNKALGAKTKDTVNLFYEKSAVYFQSAVKAEPDSADTYKNLAYVYFNLGRTDDAISPLTKLISLKKTPEGFRHLGQLYYNKGVEARANYDKTKVAADSVTALANFNKAIEVLEDGRKNNPGDQDILVLLSNANKAEIALGTFQEGVKANPENKYYRYNLAVLLLGKNQYPEAIEQFKAALTIDPEYLNAIYNIAVCYVKWGVQLQKQADEAGKEDPNIKEKYRLALPHLEAYVQKKQDDAPTWELLGKVYSVLSMNDDANKAFEKADKIRNK